VKVLVSYTALDGQNPFTTNPALGTRAKFNQTFSKMKGAINGGGVWSAVGTHPIIQVGTTSSTAIVTLASVQAGDTVTLNGQAITAVSGAPANNEFDISGTNAAGATSLAGAVLASTTALVSTHLVANTRSAIVTCASVAVGDYVVLAGERLTAGVTATDNGGSRVTTAPPNFWCQAGNDTTDGTSLTNCINAHPRLSQLFFAVNASGAVSIFERYPGIGKECTVQTNNGSRLAVTGTVSNSGGLFAPSASVLFEARFPGAPGNAITIATSNGSRLAITGSLSRLAGGVNTNFTF